MMKTVVGAAVAGLTLLLLEAQTKRAQSVEYPRPDIREEQQVMVGGIAETWQLKWTSPPQPTCEPSEASLACPCSGFAYGEGGNLILVRLRNHTEIERLAITPLFKGEFSGSGSPAVIQRWQPDHAKDFEASQETDFVSVVAKRPTVQVMHFADYDHDGTATEFYLQTEAAPCEKSVGVIIGLSARDPRLHVFGTASKPNAALYLQKDEWDALRRAKDPIEIIDWRCGDHGAETETRLRLHWTPNGVDGTRREFSCPPGPQRLLSEAPL